ncbi:MAG TPA: class I SAM-dependent methyltransferase [Ktedonobacteraceae bacterium]
MSDEPKQEHPSTYFVQDRSNKEEMNRLRVFDRTLNTVMGGVLPEQASRDPFGTVLDIGCGTGGWLIELAKTTPTCTWLVGVDVSRAFVEEANIQAQAAGVSDRVKFQTMDALRMLEFPRNSFDLVNQRSGVSWLRTWDWPKLLHECQRVCRPGGVVRITEPEVVIKSKAPAFSRLQGLWLQAFFQAGHLFTPSSDGLTKELARLQERHGLQAVQTRAHIIEYRANTPELHFVVENNKLFFRTILPFLQKWTHVPENYDALYQEMLSEMQQPDFAATAGLLTAWGITPALSTQPQGDY